MIELNEQYLTDKNGNCSDVTDAILEGLKNVKNGQTVAMDDLLDALRD